MAISPGSYSRSQFTVSLIANIIVSLNVKSLIFLAISPQATSDSLHEMITLLHESEDLVASLRLELEVLRDSNIEQTGSVQVESSKSAGKDESQVNERYCLMLIVFSITILVFI